MAARERDRATPSQMFVNLQVAAVLCWLMTVGV